MQLSTLKGPLVEEQGIPAERFVLETLIWTMAPTLSMRWLTLHVRARFPFFLPRFGLVLLGLGGMVQ